MLVLTSLILSNTALAVPVQLNQHGRLLDSDNAPVDGIHVLAFRLYDSQLSGTMLWEEGLQVTFVNGYYSVVLGGNTASNPLSDTVLKTQPLYLELEIDGEGPIGLRQEIVSTPYARLAGTATHVDGGTVNASELSIGGNIVVDSSGSWVGETMIISWGDITGIPSDLTDGDDNTQLSEQEVEDMITNGSVDLAAGTTLSGNAILTSADTLSADWSNTTNIPQDLQDGDQDTVGALSCGAGEVAKFNGTSWGCEADLVLGEQEVEDLVSNSPLDLAAGTTIGGAAVMTSTTCNTGEILSFDGTDWVCSSFQALLDGDGDGIMAWADCDDTDAQILESTNDADCDGIATSDDCDDNDPNIAALSGTTSDCPGSSCKQLLDAGLSTGDGAYWIKTGSDPAIQMECDMTTDGGGWTICAKQEFSSGGNYLGNSQLSSSWGSFGSNQYGHDCSTRMYEVSGGGDVQFALMGSKQNEWQWVSPFNTTAFSNRLSGDEDGSSCDQNVPVTTCKGSASGGEIAVSKYPACHNYGGHRTSDSYFIYQVSDSINSNILMEIGQGDVNHPVGIRPDCGGSDWFGSCGDAAGSVTYQSDHCSGRNGGVVTVAFREL